MNFALPPLQPRKPSGLSDGEPFNASTLEHRQSRSDLGTLAETTSDSLLLL
jgi:hypothetical protein